MEEWQEVEEALDGIGPGETVIVRGHEYTKPMRACVNCDHLTDRFGQLWCRAMEEEIPAADLDKDRRDCEFWDFRIGRYI